MLIFRRLLGLFVMFAGVIGILLSLAGLVGIWVVKPGLIVSINSTIETLSSSVDTSQKALVIADDALTATVATIDALSEMLSTTAGTVEDTQPVISQIETLMGESLPNTLKTAGDSLSASQQAAVSLESAIQSFEAFRMILEATPLLSAFLPESEGSYNPEKSLADSLGELSENIQAMPEMFTEMSNDLNKADDNLDLIKEDLDVMAENVSLISTSLVEYQTMLGESGASMDNLNSLLSNIQSSMGRILNIATIVLVLFFLWLLAAQVVIFSQGLELYHGTASRMDTGEGKSDNQDAEVTE